MSWCWYVTTPNCVYSYVLCAECFPGYVGANCSHTCRYPSYGVGCQGVCQCDHRKCHPIRGCSQSTGTHYNNIYGCVILNKNYLHEEKLGVSLIWYLYVLNFVSSYMYIFKAQPDVLWYILLHVSCCHRLEFLQRWTVFQ